ncbi:endonuclease/exonuclease/phosphatase family metal-dependent hydrolase [Larkinella arboricola]|uniref:Endonuclease/exonuclease/phosphatase family metal-dependent hydrolase n=1 Tax=Larkinella arboricola TaxID=643671 RepID=A0A327WR44_LARAB|nr:endonuclease/exonuclease/phosphatase family protein [Larkinella arboricola]RAJ94469.1 endonuclease/exonuclease/phosphatase family metal-dependent hydrolase [Larkinella arboricola]
MRVAFLLLTVFVLVANVSAQTVPTGTARLALNILSFNIQATTPQDGLNAWPNRREMAAGVIRNYQVDFAGLQEALAGQIADLQDQLPTYGWIGAGREDGKQQGEFCPIFYNKQKFELLKQGTFWLSETPDVPGSQSWEAAFPRVATYGIFEDKRNGRQVFVINTHFDHISETARQNSAKLLIARIKKVSQDLPVILTGDFNTPEISPALQTLTSHSSVKLTNTERLSENPHTGGKSTFNGFRTDQRGPVIDFIFVGPDIDVNRHDYLPIMKDNVFISDHWPVLSRVLLK